MMKSVGSLVLMLVAGLSAMAQSWLGGDISMMTSNARNGVIYKDSCGMNVDPYDLFRQQPLTKPVVRNSKRNAAKNMIKLWACRPSLC